MKLDGKRADLVQKFMPQSHVEFFATNAPDPPHWTINWYFGAFCTIWVHSGPFGCLTKLGAIRAELVQKFVPRSRVGIFRNECTRTTPLDPKLMFWCVRTILVHSGLFGCLTKLGAQRAELDKDTPRMSGSVSESFTVLIKFLDKTNLWIFHPTSVHRN